MLLFFQIDLNTLRPSWLCPETRRLLKVFSGLPSPDDVDSTMAAADQLKQAWQRVKEQGDSSYQVTLDTCEGRITFDCHGYLTGDGQMISYAYPANDIALGKQIEAEKMARFLGQQPDDLRDLITQFAAVKIDAKVIFLTFANRHYAEALRCQEERIILGELFADHSLQINSADTPIQQSL